MPFGTNPPSLDRNVASLSLREILELSRIAQEAMVDGADPDSFITDQGEQFPESTLTENGGGEDDDD